MKKNGIVAGFVVVLFLLILLGVALAFFAMYPKESNTTLKRSSHSPIAYEDVDVEQMVGKVQGVSEKVVAWAFGEKSPSEKKSEKKAEAMLASAKTFEEVREVLWFAPTGTEVKKIAEEKIVSFLPDMLASATTVEEIDVVLRYSPEGSELEKAAQAKLNLLLAQKLASAKTLEEVADVLRYAGGGESEAGRAALAKIDALLPNALAVATTLEEIRYVLRFAPRDSEVEKAARAKFYFMIQRELASATTIEAVDKVRETLWKAGLLDGEPAKMLIRTYAEFFPKKKK